MRYIKIAATLNDKTVRDVAMRCRWMAVSGSNPKKKILLQSSGDFEFLTVKMV